MVPHVCVFSSYATQPTNGSGFTTIQKSTQQDKHLLIRCILTAYLAINLAKAGSINPFLQLSDFILFYVALIYKFHGQHFVPNTLSLERHESGEDHGHGRGKDGTSKSRSARIVVH